MQTTAIEDNERHEGGPLENVHIKQLVQRNALEKLKCDKRQQGIETQKKAFVRQSTRDETEMKSLLQRLQLEQECLHTDEDVDAVSVTLSIEDQCASEDEDEEDEKSDDDEKKIVNPYPITIVPKFGASPPKTIMQQTKGSNSQTVYTNKGRRKSIEFEDVQETLTLASPRRTGPSVSSIHDPTLSSSSISGSPDEKEKWMGDPSAISSVRRPRLSVAEQMHRKMLLRSNSELAFSLEHDLMSQASGTATPMHRTSSWKERKTSRDENRDPTGSPPRRISVGSRGGSFKDKKRNVDLESLNENSGIIRSYSTSHSILSRKGSKKDVFKISDSTDDVSSDRLKRHSSLKERPTKALSTHVDNTEENHPRARHGSIKERKRREGMDVDNSLGMHRFRKISDKGAELSEETDPKHSRKGSKKGTKAMKKLSNEDVAQNEGERGKPKEILKRKDTPPKGHPSSVTSGFSSSLDENTLRGALGPKRKPYRPIPRPIAAAPLASPEVTPEVSPVAKEVGFKY